MPAIKPKARTQLAVVEVDGEAVIYDELSEELHHLNPTATIIFSLCDGSATIKELAGDVAEAFAVPLEEIEPQIRSLVLDFRKAGLLEGRPGSTP